MALPALPTGGEQHKAAVDSLAKLSKAFPASEEVPGVQNTQLMALSEQAKKNAMLQAVMRAHQAQGGDQAAAGPAPAAAAAPPQMAA
jgi:hypothetical protein